MSKEPPQEKKASTKILNGQKHLSKTLTRIEENLEKLGERPEIINVQDAKVLRKHLETCTEPGCPYKPIFPELAPSEPPEAAEEQARPEPPGTPETEPPQEHQPPKRWSVSHIGRRRTEAED